MLSSLLKSVVTCSVLCKELMETEGCLSSPLVVEEEIRASPHLFVPVFWAQKLGLQRNQGSLTILGSLERGYGRYVYRSQSLCHKLLEAGGVVNAKQRVSMVHPVDHFFGNQAVLY